MKKSARIRILAAGLVLVLLTAFTPVDAAAGSTVTVIHSSEVIASSPTVYLGEVVLDGYTALKYVYSADFRLFDASAESLSNALAATDDPVFASLFGEYVEETEPGTGIKAGGDPGEMDEKWASAKNVGELLYPSAATVTVSGGNFYEADEKFRAAVDAMQEARTKEIDEPVPCEKRLVIPYDSQTVTDVYYTIEDSQVVRHVEATVTYYCDAITVLYTRAELTTGQVVQGKLRLKDGVSAAIKNAPSVSGVSLSGNALADFGHGKTETEIEALFDLPAGAEVAFKDPDGSAHDPESPVGSGVVVELILGGQTVDSLTLLVKGDGDGSGGCDVFDAVALLSWIVDSNNAPLSPARLIALDVDGSGSVDVFDAVAILTYIVNGGWTA